NKAVSETLRATAPTAGSGTMPLNGDQAKQLQEAILSGFDRSQLEQMVLTTLDRRLDIITAPGSLETVSFELIQWAERQGRTEELIRAVRQAPRRHPQVQSVTKSLLSLVDPTWRAAEQANRNRSAMIERVRAIWITGFLQRSLFREVRILLGLSERRDAVMRP